MPKVGVNITQREYYQNNGNNPAFENWGTYQYLLLDDIINNFVKEAISKFEIKKYFKSNKSLPPFPM